MLHPDFNNSSQNIQTGEIFTSSVGRWRQALSADEAFVAQLTCGRAMRTLGYPTASLRAPLLEVLRLFVGAPMFAVRAVANRKRVGRLFPYIARRISLPSPRA